jgi:FSR family fosmidomycin resistance protein-like MFS transporter
VEKGKQGGCLALCCAAHFAVDFACAFLLLGLLPEGGNRPLWFLLYNFCAFALQMPLGLLADRYRRCPALASAGCLLAAAAYLLPAFPLSAALAAGLGNALFHVGAGLAVLTEENGRCGPLGAFVSPGAIGLYAGSLLAGAGSGQGLSLLPPLALLAAAAGFLRLKTFPSLPGQVLFSLELRPGELFPAVCIFLVVCLRSWLSLSLPLPWKGEAGWGLAFACALALGKTLGGYAADRFGLLRAALLPLGFSALLLPVCGLPVPGLLAVLLLNMSMPVTLWAAARLFPGAKGFSFGLLTFALFIGFLPGYLSAGPALPAAGAAVGAAVSLLLLGAGLRRLP